MNKYKNHFLFWSLFFIYVLIADMTFYPRIVLADELIIFLTNNIFIFYSSLWCARKIKFNNILNGMASVLRFIIAIALYCSFKYIYRKYLSQYLDSPYAGIKSIDTFFMECTYWYVQYTLFAVGYYFLDKAKHLEVDKARMQADSFRLEAANRQLEAEKVKTEYNYLRTQINPHFLYNVLNMFYGQTIESLPKTAHGLLLLTEIMRYSLNTGDKEDGKVYLEDEIEQLNNFIALQQLRFNDELQIKMEVSGPVEGLRILPHIFLTFVENAIKHGETLDVEQPVFIDICVTDDKINFLIINKPGRSTKDAPGTGLGIANTASRLRLQYGDQLEFFNGMVGDLYKVFFSIAVTTETGGKNNRIQSNQ